MPYGIEVQRLDTVKLAGELEIAVLPQVMQELNLQPGQLIDDETAKKIIAENDRLNRTK